MDLRAAIVIAIVGIAAADVGAAPLPTGPPEESPFAWVGDFDAARSDSLRTGKPVVLVFDVPEQRWDLHIGARVLRGSALAQVIRGFTWVALTDTEQSRTLRERFRPGGFPSLLVLGPNDENIHRTAGFLSPEQLGTFLGEAARRYALFDRGLDWEDPPAPRAPTPNPKYTFTTLPAPSDGLPESIGTIAGTVFVKQGPLMFRLNGTTGEVLGSFPLQGSVSDLASDGGLLYAVDYCWSMGAPIRVVDPEDGEVLRTIVTRANASGKYCAPMGIEVLDGRIWVLEMGKLHEVDAATGDIVRTITTKAPGTHGLAFDGTRFVTLSPAGVVFFDAESGQTGRVVPMSYPLRSIAFGEGRFFFAEQAVSVIDRNHDTVRISPQVPVLHVSTLRP